ncbi:hypothetical protein ACIRFH_33865 [Streptomyces sp. NPDC093586]|uniref:RICIN domain-containing protein n=1 Tax=Streptomyces sp. NPDC093586 TaxID=3366042 RepID=UPI00381AD66E
MKRIELLNRPMKAIRRAALPAVTAGLALGLTPAPAQAADITVTGTYQNKQTGRCLDGNAIGEIYTSVCDPNRGNKYQQWVFTYSGPNAHTIRQVATGNCPRISWNGSYLSSHNFSVDVRSDLPWFVIARSWY